jgi:16S rRNA (uracil1498-N3)-methyltransferase
MPDRFYLPGVWEEFVELEGTEAHHLLNVLRMRPGQSVEIFDGKGRSAVAEITAAKKRTATLRVTSATAVDIPTRPEIVLAVPNPKGDRLKWLLEKVTELGVDRFIPLKTTRSVVEPSDQKKVKLEQNVIAACKQCRRNTLLQIDDVCSLPELLAQVGVPGTVAYWGEAGTNSSDGHRNLDNVQRILAIVGPEGGFTDSEKALIQDSGATPISLSPHILRIETAAISFAAFLQSRKMER